MAYLGFKITENGVFTVIDYKEDPQEVATYKHFEFAKRKMKAIDHEQVCIKNEKEKSSRSRKALSTFTQKMPVKTPNIRWKTEKTATWMETMARTACILIQAKMENKSSFKWPA